MQSSLLDLARAGDFSALAYWINRVLIPDGFYAHVEGQGTRGCVNICVEFPAPRTAQQTDLQDNIIRRICHQLWQLNSKVIHGVRVSGSLPGRAEILWQQTVRIVTPANQRLRWKGDDRLDFAAIVRPVMRGAVSVRVWVRSRYKALRTLLLAGSAVAAFTLGAWFSVNSALEWVNQNAARSAQTPPLVTGQTLPRSERLTAMPDQMSETVADSGSTSTASSMSSLDRIQSILQEMDRSSITPVTPPPNRVQSEDVVLLIGGDISFDGPLAGNNAQAFADLGALAAADVTAVNLESPLSLADRAEAQFRSEMTTASPASDNRHRSFQSGAIAALNSAGVDVVNLANGRIMTDGDQGLEVTLNELDQANIVSFGAGRTASEAARVRIVDVKGVKIAYLGYATADYTIAQDRRSGINEALRDRIRQDITGLRDRVDWIVVNYHWGDSMASYPAHWQTQLARETIDVGADAVVGHSPNALQGAETYNDRPIVYSLGKLLYSDKYGFGGETALLRLRLDRDRIAADFVPIEIWDGRPVVAAEASANWIMQRIEDLSQGFDQPLAQRAEGVEGLSASEREISAERHRVARMTAETSSDLSNSNETDTRQPIATQAAVTATAELKTFEVSTDASIANTESETPTVDRDASVAVPPPTRESQSVAPPIAPPLIASELAQQTLPPLSGRTIVEQSLDRLAETNPQIQQKLYPSTPPVNPEVDLEFQHPNLSNSRRDLASELKALELELDPEDLTSPPAIQPQPSENLTLNPPATPSPKLDLPSFSTAAPTPSSPSPADATSPFSNEPIVAPVNPSDPSSAQLPQRLPLDEFKSIGQAIGQWSRSKTPSPVSFAIPRLNSPTFPAQPTRPTLPNY